MAKNTQKYLHCKHLSGMKRTVIVILAGILLTLLAVGALAAADPADTGNAPRNATALSESLKTDIKNAIMACQETIDISKYNLPYTDEVLLQIDDYARNGSPLFFNYNGDWGVAGKGDPLTAIKITYKYTSSEFESMKIKIEAAADSLLAGIRGNDSLGDEEKALLIHDRLALRCEYSETADNATSIYGALIGRKAQCKGYTMAYWYLLEQAGLKTEPVISDTLDHMWNIVYINGKPYHADVTWDDPDVDVTGRVLHDNFLLSSKALSGSHKASDYNTAPSDTRYDNYFWQKSRAAFVLLGGDIYYVDNVNGDIKKYSDKSTLLTVNAVWPNYKESGKTINFKLIRLCTDGKDLFYNTEKELICYSVSGKTSKTVHTFTEPRKSVVGLTYENGWLIGEYTADGKQYSSDTKAKDGFRIEYKKDDEPEPSVSVPDNLCDVDGNGKIESADARLALRASVKLENYKEGSDAFKAADVDGSGAITCADARLILRLSIKLEKLDDLIAKYGNPVDDSFCIV